VGVTIDRDTIRHLERLARLRLGDDEAEAIAGELGRIVEFVRAVQTAEAGDTVGSTAPRPATLRSDEAAPGLERDRVLEGAPDVADGSFVVPRVIERREE
jgi:aspartyl-tRNA(Asn)/glutamyl-tRNA(Gln) amidotransferase subunit C